jgi:hypothetical protein
MTGLNGMSFLSWNFLVGVDVGSAVGDDVETAALGTRMRKSIPRVATGGSSGDSGAGRSLAMTLDRTLAEFDAGQRVIQREFLVKASSPPDVNTWFRRAREDYRDAAFRLAEAEASLQLHREKAAFVETARKTISIACGSIGKSSGASVAGAQSPAVVTRAKPIADPASSAAPGLAQVSTPADRVLFTAN